MSALIEQRSTIISHLNSVKLLSISLVSDNATEWEGCLLFAFNVVVSRLHIIESVWTRIRSLHTELLSSGPYCFAIYTRFKYLSVHFHVVCISMYMYIVILL